MFRTPVARLARSVVRCHGAPLGLPQPPKGRLRLSTDITGLAVEGDPLEKLQGVYATTIRLLAKLPPTSVYRQATAALTEFRSQAVANAINDHANALKAKGPEKAVLEDTIKALEAELDAGLVEEVLKQAKKEEVLAAKMLEWQAYVSSLLWSFLAPRAWPLSACREYVWHPDFGQPLVCTECEWTLTLENLLLPFFRLLRHEPLDVQPPPGQWDYFDIRHETGEAGEVKQTKPIS